MVTHAPVSYKTILLLSVTYPPQGGSGVQRVYYQANELARHGHNVWVISKSLEKSWVSDVTFRNYAFDENKLIRVGGGGNNALARVLRHLKRYIWPLDKEFWWARKAFRAAEHLVLNQKVDTILCSAGTPSVMRVGYKLKLRYPGIKLVIDHRDLGSLNPVQFGVSGPLELGKELRIWLEDKWRANADLIIAVSEAHQRLLENRSGKQVAVIENGYDQGLFDRSPATLPRNACFTIRYLGFVHDTMPLDAFLEAVTLAVGPSGDGLNLRVEFFGGSPSAVRAAADRHGLGDIVLAFGYVDHPSAVSLMKGADLLLLLWTPDPGCMCGKLYEYIGSQAPILAVGYEENSEGRRRLAQVGNSQCFLLDEQSSMADWLVALVKKRIAPPPAIYSRRTLLTRQAQCKVLSKCIEAL